MTEISADPDSVDLLTAQVDALQTAVSNLAAERNRLAEANEHWHTRVGQLKADNDTLLQERDRLVALNERLVNGLEKIAQIQRDKCENASAEMLFMLLDNKVGIARAVLDESRKP